MRGWAITITLILLAGIPGATGLAAPTNASLPATNTLEAPGSDAPWARQVVEELPRATAVNDADGDKVFDDLETAYQQVAGAQLPVIVVFTHDTSISQGLAAVEATIGPVDPTFTYHILPGYAGELTYDRALQVGELDEVRQIELDRKGTPELSTATASMGVDAVQEQLAITGDRDGDETSYTPEDVTIAILDTGFDGGHEGLDEGKIVHFFDVANGKEEAYDSGSHGTHVAGIAAGTGDVDPKHTGVAPGAGIVGIKIVDSEASCTGILILAACDGESSLSLAIEGYEWIVENKETYGIDVSTISFGFGTATDGTTSIELAIDEVWEAGVVNFKSTGNGGPEQRTITVPAAARGIMATGAMLDPLGAQSPQATGTPADQLVSASFGFQLATFSSRGPTSDGRVKPDIAAPGVSIMSTEAGTEEGYVAFSGTSMASPFAAGTAALVLDANPELSPDEVREVLTSTTEDWGLEGDDVDYGWGRLQVHDAVAEALRRAGQTANLTTPVVPFHEARAGILASASGTDPGTALGTETIEVEETEMPFAVTAIVEGKLLEVVVEDPSGDIVASFQPFDPAARQHVLGFEAHETGPHTIRLIGQPQAPYVLDVSHGTAGGISIDLPDAGDVPIEAASEEADGVPLGIAPILAGLVVASALVGRRRR